MRGKDYGEAEYEITTEFARKYKGNSQQHWQTKTTTKFITEFTKKSQRLSTRLSKEFKKKIAKEFTKYTQENDNSHEDS